jgi:hypothetical protein
MINSFHESLALRNGDDDDDDDDDEQSNIQLSLLDPFFAHLYTCVRMVTRHAHAAGKGPFNEPDRPHPRRYPQRKI